MLAISYPTFDFDIHNMLDPIYTFFKLHDNCGHLGLLLIACFDHCLLPPIILAILVAQEQ